MATGDLKNNIARLESDLKSVKFTQSLPIYSISNGDPTSFLPLLHHVLLDYSPLLLKYFANRSYDFYGKKDSRFIEAVYSALRDEFTYKPKITKEQFFAKGFAERKCLFISDVIRLCRGLHQDLARKAKPSPAAIVTKKSASNTQVQTQSKSKGTVPPSPVKLAHSSPARVAVFQKSEYSPSKSPSYPPSKHLSNTFWTDTAAKLSQSPLAPPVPAEKPPRAGGGSSIYHQDDSLLFYENSNFSEHSHHFHDDYSNIVDTGKPIEISDYYQESLASGKPQTRAYDLNADAVSFRSTSPLPLDSNRTPSPTKSAPKESNTFGRQREEKEDVVIVEKFKSPPRSGRVTPQTAGASPSRVSQETVALRTELEIVKKELLFNQTQKEKLEKDLVQIKDRVSTLEGLVERLSLENRQPDQNKENKVIPPPVEKEIPSEKAILGPIDAIDRIKLIQQKLSQAKKTLK